MEAVVRAMEDDPTFDAGRGAFLNAAGEIELDAGVMDGSTLRAGAVAAVRNIRNPISLARLVMDKTEHVLLAGDGAAQFARNRAPVLAIPRTCWSGELDRWRELQRHPDFRTPDAFRPDRPGDTVGAWPATRTAAWPPARQRAARPRRCPAAWAIPL